MLAQFPENLEYQNGRSISTPRGLRILPSNWSDKASPISSWLISELQPARVGLGTGSLRESESPAGRCQRGF
jgi:hypothetical protein